MKSTLFIHPSDITTAFLSEIYEGKGWTIMSDMKPDDEYLRTQIQKHDRIIIMGHGTTDGLLGRYEYEYIIDSSFVDILKDKELICMWCEADVFFRKHGLKGFYTGMIISELREAKWKEVPATEEDIIISNALMTKAFKHHIDDLDILEGILSEYHDEYSDVIKYNRKRLYFDKA